MAKRRDDGERPTLGLVLVRLVAGGVLVAHGWRWIQDGGLDGRLVRRCVADALPSVPGLVAWWGEHAVLYNPDASAFLWRWAALLLGLGLFFGALTRPLGWAAVLLLLHGYAFGPAGTELPFLLLVVCCLACALSRAGRRAGLDSVFDRHFPAWATWTRSSSSGSLF